MLRLHVSFLVFLVLAQSALGQATLGPPTMLLPDPTSAVAQPAALQEAQQAQPPDKMSVLEQKLDAISKNLTVTTADPSIKLVLGGAVIADFLYNSARPVAPGTPFFLTPAPFDGFRQSTFDASARQNTLLGMVVGPEVCGFQSGAQVAGVLYSSSLIEDLWGFLTIEAYAQLKNDNWPFAAGLQFDIFNPLNPTILPIT